MSICKSLVNELEKSLDIPYPEKANLIAEVREDFYCAMRDNPQLSSVEVAKSFDFSKKDLEQISEIHNTKIYKIFKKMNSTNRQAIELVLSFIPLLSLATFLILEVPMLFFLKQGGLAVWPIILFGTVAILMQLKTIFSWFVVKDHSKKSLSRPTDFSLIFGATAFFFGIFGTILGLYVVFSHVVALPSQEEMIKIAFIGMSEALVPLILASAFAGIIAMNYFCIKCCSRYFKLPIG